jgi:SAM-dependent methyltransferase
MKDMNSAKDLGSAYWDERYKTNATGWDIGAVSPPLKMYIDMLDDKNTSILIPGCGNTYEADYLLQKGFTDITVIDIAPSLVQKLKEKYKGNSHIKIILGDFFEHAGHYDIILEQTFFCALDPALRKKYKEKMYSLLNPGGKLAGVLFSKEFEEAGPPFGGSKAEYEKLFQDHFEFLRFEPCANSHPKRQGSEIFMVLEKIVIV